MQLTYLTCCLRDRPQSWGRHRAVALAGLLALALMPPGSARAAQPVDPATLLPPPFGDTVTCQVTGGGTICDSTLASTSDSYVRVSCPGFNIVEVDRENDKATFSYDQNGALTRSATHGSVSATLTNSVTGASLPLHAALSETRNLAIPGDLATAVSTLRGEIFQVVVPGRGVVLQDVGILIFTPDPSVPYGIVEQGGHHQLVDYLIGTDPDVVQPLCAALAAPA